MQARGKEGGGGGGGGYPNLTPEMSEKRGKKREAGQRDE